MKARDIMTADPQVVTPNDTVARAAEIMRDTDVGIVPVVDDVTSRRLRGVITDRDIAIRHVAEHHHDDCRVASHMSQGVATATPDEDVNTVMARMRTEQVRRIPVVEDGDRLVGIIAQADLATEIGPLDPEKVELTLEQLSQPSSRDR
jgi:CBS domain-containing protein